jgi:hypothetical protein
MIADGLGLLLLVVGGVSVAAWLAYKRNRKIGDEQLREWLSFITKSNGRPSSARLGADDYDAIKLLFHPALKAEYEEKQTRLDNEFSARAIEATLVFRRQAAGLPLSEIDDAIMIREGLRKSNSLQRDNEPTQDRNENEV